jgi:hypothetical protein
MLGFFFRYGGFGTLIGRLLRLERAVGNDGSANVINDDTITLDKMNNDVLLMT